MLLSYDVTNVKSLITLVIYRTKLYHKYKYLDKHFLIHVYVYIKLLGKIFSLGPDEARSNLSKACLS